MPTSSARYTCGRPSRPFAARRPPQPDRPGRHDDAATRGGHRPTQTRLQCKGPTRAAATIADPGSRLPAPRRRPHRRADAKAAAARTRPEKQPGRHGRDARNGQRPPTHRLTATAALGRDYSARAPAGADAVVTGFRHRRRTDERGDACSAVRTRGDSGRRGPSTCPGGVRRGGTGAVGSPQRQPRSRAARLRRPRSGVAGGRTSAAGGATSCPGS